MSPEEVENDNMNQSSEDSDENDDERSIISDNEVIWTVIKITL